MMMGWQSANNTRRRRQEEISDAQASRPGVVMKKSARGPGEAGQRKSENGGHGGIASPVYNKSGMAASTCEGG